MSEDFPHALGARLRSVRLQRGLTLHGVEAKSEGRWKVVVLGSYERAERAITVTRLVELAEFYGVPAAQLLPERRGARPDRGGRKLVLDLSRLVELPIEMGGPLARYATVIRSERGDFNGGSKLNLRTEDMRSLAVVYGLPAETLIDHLMDWGVLSTTKG